MSVPMAAGPVPTGSAKRTIVGEVGQAVACRFCQEGAATRPRSTVTTGRDPSSMECCDPDWPRHLAGIRDIPIIRRIELVIDELVFYCGGMPGRYADLLAASYPGLGDQAEALLAATSAPEMKQAAHRLRAIALSVRQQIASPRAEDALL